MCLVSKLSTPTDPILKVYKLDLTSRLLSLRSARRTALWFSTEVEKESHYSRKRNRGN